MGKHVADPRRSVPGQTFQQINNGMEAVIVCHNIHRLGDHPVTGQSVILFQIKGQIVHIRIRHLDAPAFPWNLFHNIDLAGHFISANCSLQIRIMLQRIFAVLDRLTDLAFLCHVQVLPDFFLSQHFIFCNTL